MVAVVVKVAVTIAFVPANVKVAGLSPVDEMVPPCGSIRTHDENACPAAGMAVRVVVEPENPVGGLANAEPPGPEFTVIAQVAGRLKLKLFPSCDTGISIGVDA